MKKFFKILLLVIIWGLVVAGCLFVAKKSKEAADFQKNSTVVTGTIVKVQPRTRVERKERGPEDRIEEYYTLELYQTVTIDYSFDGKGYEIKAPEQKTYYTSSDFDFTSQEVSEIIDTKGFKVDDSIELYVNNDDPTDASLKSSVERNSSGSYVRNRIILLLFMGALFSVVVCVSIPYGRSKRRHR